MDMVLANINARQRQELESLRGLAAILVVILHIPVWNPIIDIGLIRNSGLMVELFFVLSGFVIYSAYAQKINSTEQLLKFQLLRLGRLYPVHIFFLLVFLGIEVLKAVAHARLGIENSDSMPFSTNNFATFCQNLFLVQSMVPIHDDLHSFNYPSWSISVEFYTYLLFAVIVLLARRMKEIVFLLLALIALAFLALDIRGGYSDLLRCTSGFFVGCLTAWSVKRSRLQLPSWAPFIVFLITGMYLQLKTKGEFDIAIFFLTAALIFALAHSNDGVFQSALRSKWLCWLGTISYSIYMSHAAVVWGATQAIRLILKVSHIGVVAGHEAPQLPIWAALLSNMIILCLILIVSEQVHRWIERPWRDKSRTLLGVKCRVPFDGRRV